MGKVIELSNAFLKPQELQRISETLNRGETVIMPSDTGYSLVCQLGNKSGAQSIRQIRQLDKNHLLTVFCPDLSRLSLYAKVDNVQYRLLKQLFPGAFTCILPAGKETPRLVQHDKRRTIGIRVPQASILDTVLQHYDVPLMGISVFDSNTPTADLQILDKVFINAVDLMIDAGERPNLPSTVLDLTEMPPAIIRQGAGDIRPFL